MSSLHAVVQLHATVRFITVAYCGTHVVFLDTLAQWHNCMQVIIKMSKENEKVRLHVRISRDVYEDLIRIAPAIYGNRKYKGALSFIVEQALRQYLAPFRTQTQKTQIHINPKVKIRKVYNQIIEKVMEIMQLDMKPLSIPEKILDVAIREVRGSDPRTIEKWKNALAMQGLIKFVGGSRPNRIVELV